ncbi:MAG: hypothetical protein DRP93_06400 [Candidatus Neomarinimicrobiota bacterium]|nr:MAG: hypothetical protein DRP93_06400 [Candidatus Neomarinimicrobiota bacterium]
MQKLQKRNSTRLNTVKSALLVILGTGSLLAPPAQAGRFISLMEAETFAPGLGEVVLVGNWQREKIGESEMSATNIQLGMEFGLGSRFHVGMALPAFSNLRGTDHRTTKLEGTSLWGIYNFSRPTRTSFGISGSVGVIECDENITSEIHLILEKPWKTFVTVMNLTLGRAWMRDTSEDDHKFFAGRLGLSKDLGRSVSLAVEGEYCLSFHGDIDHHMDEKRIGSSLMWSGEKVWVLSGLLFDLNPQSSVQGPALQFQTGIPF